MYPKTVNLKKVCRIALAAVIMGAVILAVFTVIKLSHPKEEPKPFDEYARISYINLKGYDVDTENYTVQKVTVPEDWNQVYREYNEVQKHQGFDLSDYKGQEVTVYTYNILNHSDKHMKAVLILTNEDSFLIGANIYSAAVRDSVKAISE
ncbi:MAG: DUF4830 domain-containing protein [Oscillospiraceae bacterium]|jgi:hypothetical protein|nr:DUF4830 domain-containing protein [Oscillospiraceae bacterium]